MVDFTLVRQPTTFPTIEIRPITEDAARDGFNNLGFFSNTFAVSTHIPTSTDFKINGQGGNDTITTGNGDDTVYGGSGNDTITTGRGTDYLYGGSGDDKLYAGADLDVVYGGSGNDTIDGGSGNDLLYGGTGDDTIYGGYDDDTMYGDDGNDILIGGHGNDQFFSGAGNDTLTGGIGADRFFINLREGVDTITDFTRGQDHIFLSYEIRSQFPTTYLDGQFDIIGRIYNANVPSSPGSDLTFSGGPVGYDAIVIFDAQTQMLSFDPDGILGTGAAIDLVKLTGVTQVGAGDFVM